MRQFDGKIKTISICSSCSVIEGQKILLLMLLLLSNSLSTVEEYNKGKNEFQRLITTLLLQLDGIWEFQHLLCLLKTFSFLH